MWHVRSVITAYWTGTHLPFTCPSSRDYGMQRGLDAQKQRSYVSKNTFVSGLLKYKETSPTSEIPIVGGGRRLSCARSISGDTTGNLRTMVNLQWCTQHPLPKVQTVLAPEIPVGLRHRGANLQQPHRFVSTSPQLLSGTTEKIFEMKTQLYDIYVDNQNVTAHVPAMQELLKVSDADRDKYQKLNNERSVRPCVVKFCWNEFHVFMRCSP